MNGGKAMDVKKGEILAGSWGYSMTLWDFYEVVSTSPKTVVLRKLKNKVIGGTQESLEVQPDLYSPLYEEFRIKNDPNQDTLFIRGKNILLNRFDPDRLYVENHID